MLLVNSKIQGYTSYYDPATIDFKEGLTGIIGEYEDDSRKSMGAGKSSILNSLLFSLFGKGLFKTQKEVVNDEYSDKQHMFTQHRFIKNNILYEVERGYYNGASYLDFFQVDSLGEEEKKIPLGDNKIASKESEILRVLNWDYDMFTASIFFEQDKLSKLVDTDGAKKREYIEKVLHLRNWTLLQELPKKKLITLDKEKADVQNKLIELGNALVSLDLKIKQYVDVEKELVDLQHNKENILKTKESLIVGVSNVKEQIGFLETLKEKLISANSNKANYVKLLSKENKELEKLKEDINGTQERLKASTTIEQSLTSEIKQLNDEKEEVKSAIKEEQASESSIQKELLTLEINIQHIEKQVLNFEEGTCFQCEQDITAEYATSKKDFYQKQVDDTKKKILALKEDLKLIENNIKSKKDSLFNIDQRFNEKNKEINEIKQQINVSTNKIESSQQQITAIESRIQDYTNFVVQEEKTLKDIDKSLSSYNITSTAGIEEVIADKRKLLDKENELISLENELKEIDKLISQKNVDKGLKEGYQSSWEETKKQKEDKEKEFESVINTIEKENFILKGFKQIPSIKFSEEIEKLQAYANDYIKKFIPYMSIFIKEDTSKQHKPIDIYYNLNNNDRSYRMLSGGQKTIGNLGLRLAFSNIISEKTSSASDFLMLDEPFAYLDAYSRDLIKEVLVDLQKIYRQIFVISHIDNVFEFPNIIKTQMKGQRSYII